METEESSTFIGMLNFRKREAIRTRVISMSGTALNIASAITANDLQISRTNGANDALLLSGTSKHLKGATRGGKDKT